MKRDELMKDEKELIEQFTKRHSASKSADFEISREKMWDLISSPGHLNKLHPFCKTNEVIRWENGKYSDELVYLNGLRYIRVFHRWSPNEGYNLLIGEEDSPQSFVDWKLAAITENSCKLQITVFPFPFAKWGRITSFFPFIIYVKPRLEKYLSSVLAGIHHNIRYGEEVPRNHFGEHPWFS